MRCRAPRFRYALPAGAALGFLLCVSSKAQPLPQDGSQLAHSGVTETQAMAAASTVPTINVGGAVNAASYAAGAPLAPGSIVAVFGSFSLSTPSQSSGLPLPTSLGGISVQFDSLPAPLFYVSGGQVNLQVPWEMATQTTSALSASLNGQAGAAQTVQLAPFSPGIFTTNAQGTGQGAILDGVSNRLVNGSDPAVPGVTILEIFGTGLGAVSHQPASGASAPDSPPFAETTTTPRVTIGGLPAKVLFSGLAPGYVGEYQVNAQVPAATLAGIEVPVVISLGGATSNTATIVVQGLSPASAIAGSGPVTVTIFGAGFSNASSLTFNGIQHAVTFVSGTELTVTLSAADLATAGTDAVVVTTPGGGSLSMNFVVNSAVFSLGGHSVTVDATVTIGNQVLSSEIGALDVGANNYSVSMNDQLALPAYPQFQIAFSCAPVSTGSSVTFNSQSLGNESGGGTYQPDPATPAGSIGAASITVTFGPLIAGAPVSGALSLITAQGTVAGNFTGTIVSIE